MIKPKSEVIYFVMLKFMNKCVKEVVVSVAILPVLWGNGKQKHCFILFSL